MSIFLGVTLNPLETHYSVKEVSEPARFRVLVADDDEWTRSLLRSYLVGEGVQVELARNGKEATERFLQTQPDVVFLDVEMPGSTGLEVLALIRENHPNTAVIITTAYGSADVVVKALRRGADDYLRKPFDQGDLQALLDRTIAKLLLSRQNAALRERVIEHQRHIDEELARAARVIGELLPPAPPLVPGFELAAACVAAREVGGDFYDWQKLPSGALSLTIGDVMGKGLSAALLMATVRAVLRALITDNAPAAAVQRTAAALDEDLARAGAFVTLFHAQIDASSGRVGYVDGPPGRRRQPYGRPRRARWSRPNGTRCSTSCIVSGSSISRRRKSRPRARGTDVSLLDANDVSHPGRRAGSPGAARPRAASGVRKAGARRDGPESDLVVGHHEAEGADPVPLLLAVCDPRSV